MHPENFLPLLLLAVTLLWSLQLAYAPRGTWGDDWLRFLLHVSGWLALILGSMVALLVFAPGPLFVMIPLFLVVTLGVIHRYRDTERRALLWTLAFAIEKNIPLPQAVQAFAQERTDELGLRCWQLASALSQGMPLDIALRAARLSAPAELILAIRAGEHYQLLPDTLRASSEQRNQIERTLRQLLERMVFLQMGVAFFSGILTFMFVKILPTFSHMFRDFELELPYLTKTLIAVGDNPFAYGWILAPLALLVSLASFLCLLQFVGWLPHNLPGLGWLRMSYDRTILLRALALAMRRKQPLPQACETLYVMIPIDALRARLRKACNQLEKGLGWPEALRRARLITSYEQAVLAAADKVGNVPWALEVLADTAVQRLARRLRVVLAVFTSLAFAFFSGLVLVYCVALMSPLIDLIVNLS